MSMTEKRKNLRAIVRGMYDLQKLRIQMGNRIVANFKVKVGQEPGKKEEDIEDDAKALLKILRSEHKLIATAIASKPRIRNAFSGAELISSFTEYVLVDNYFRVEEAETTAAKSIGKILTEFPIWVNFLDGVKGVGPSMGGVIISEINIEECTYPSSLWAYAGLDVAQDGRGRSRRAEHLVEREYQDKDGETKTRKGITFNPFLKTKLVGVLGSSFLKSRSPYADIYYGYKNRLDNSPAHAEKSKGHKHNMSVRYAVKRFLADLYAAWRTLEGLPVSTEYAEGKLNIVHRKEVA